MSETATERLRELLDKRGIEWRDRSAHPGERQYITDFKSNGFLIAAVESHGGELELMSDYYRPITPEQVISLLDGKADNTRVRVSHHSYMCEELLFCPCCGGYNIIFAEYTKNKGAIICHDCNLKLVAYGDHTGGWRKKAARKWNTRAHACKEVGEQCQSS